MKKTFFIFLLASLSFSASAESCWEPFKLNKVFGDLMTGMDDPCQKKLGTDSVSKLNDDYCGCLTQSKGVLLNLLKDSKPASNPRVQDRAKKAADKRKNQLDNIYRYLNFEVSLQEQKYGLTENNKQVGCTSKVMANTYKKALCGEGSTACPLDGAAPSTPVPDLGKATYLFDASKMFQPKPERTGQVAKNLNNAMEFAKLSPAEMKNVFKSLEMKKYNDKEREEIDIIRASKASEAEQLASIDRVTLRANARIASEAQAAKPGSAPVGEILSPYEIAFRSTFKNADDKILKQFQIDHKASIEGACLDYDVFKVIDGYPKPDMMNEWLTKTPEQISSSFLPDNLKKNDAQLNFLRRNPVLAKNMISKDQRDKLAEALSKFAHENKGIRPEQMADKYAAFMKGPIKKLNTENEVGSLLQCDLLAQNYAAASDPQMSLALLTDEENELTKMANNLQVCQVREDNKTLDKEDVPTLDEIINANELFAIFNTPEAEGNMFGPKSDKGYNDYLKKNCHDDDMKKLEKKYTSGFLRCTFISDEKCALKARDTETGKRERILEEYYKLHPEMGALVQAVKRNTNKLDVDIVANKTNESKQNQEVHTAYEKYVRPSVLNRSMYSVSNAMGAPVGSGSSSQDSSIAEAVNKAQESYSSTHTESQIAGSGHTSESAASSTANADANVSAPQTAAGSAANPGQYIPPFLDTPKSTKSESSPKISNLDEARDVLEDMTNAPEDEKAELASKAKEYLNAQDQTSQDIADLQKKLADYEQKKIAAPKAVADNTKVTSRAPASVNFTAPTVTNKVSNGGSQAFANNSASPSSSGSARLSSANSVSKAAASYANALNQANESKTDPKSLSLVVESGAVFDFNNSPVARAPGELVIGTALEPSDKLYAEISSDPEAMKAYLAQNLKEIPVDKVVSIKCKGAGCNAGASEILLVITKGSDNKFSIRSVSRETKVARSHRIQDLKNEINKVVH